MLKEYKKRKYTIVAEKISAGVKIHDVLKNTDDITTEKKCIKLTGIAGETWIITIEELIANYCFTNGKVIRKNKLPTKKFKIKRIIKQTEKTIFAEQTKKKIKIINKFGKTILTNQEGIPHGNGDYIIYKNKNGIPIFEDRDVVNGEIFLKIYEEI